jgi:predicted protein tyrosine phosphatase
MGKMQRHFVQTNSAQGPTLRVLFVCELGILRSPTAAHWAACKKGWNTRSAGTHGDAVPPLHESVIRWAQRIYVMQPDQIQYIEEAYGIQIQEKARVMHIPDEFHYMSPQLVKIIASVLELE